MSRLFARVVLFGVCILSSCLLHSQQPVNVLTWHNDIFRTGQNLRETILTPANVTPVGFGKVFSYPVDGMIYGQPLYVQHVAIPGNGTHNVVYVTTQNDSVYAFDADSAKLNPNPLWHVNFTNPPGVVPVPCIDNQPDCNVYPIIGITGTPVISLGNHSIYMVARTKETDGQGQVSYFSRLHEWTSRLERRGLEVRWSSAVSSPVRPARSTTARKRVRLTHSIKWRVRLYS